MYKIEEKLHNYEVWAISTDRLRLSIFKPSRAGAVADYFRRNRQFHAKWSQTHSEDYFTSKTQREYLKYDVKEFRRGTIVPLWITLKDDPDTIVGRVSFFNFAYGGMMSCSLGYHLDQKMTGHGYITEAIKSSCAMLADIMHIHRIEAFILPENEKSLAVINRCGFTQEGIRYSYMHINGSWRDHIAFYILDENIKKYKKPNKTA